MQFIQNGKQYLSLNLIKVQLNSKFVAEILELLTIFALLFFQSFFGLNFGQQADIDIILDNQDERKMAEIRDENGRKERHYLFFDGESVNGKVCKHMFTPYDLSRLK